MHWTPEKLAALGPAKALALACYGEDMAAYRYLQLSEKAEREQDRAEFREMVAEEQGHRDGLQKLLDTHYPGSEFVLSQEEKQMVESGSRSLKITDRRGFEQAVRMVIESELLTARFYAEMVPIVDVPQIRDMFRALAEEGVEHHQRLCQIATENNISAEA